MGRAGITQTDTGTRTAQKLMPRLLSHGTYAFYLVDADGNDKAWRDQDHGRDRIGSWEKRKECAV